MSDSKDFQDAESVRSGDSHVASRPVSFPLHTNSEGMFIFRNAATQRKAAKYLGYTGYIGKRFCSSTCVFLSTFSSGIESMETSFEEPLHSTTVEKSERQEQNQDPRCQSGLSVKNSVIFSGGDSSNNYGADQQRLQSQKEYIDRMKDGQRDIYYIRHRGFGGFSSEHFSADSAAEPDPARDQEEPCGTVPRIVRRNCRVE